MDPGESCRTIGVGPDVFDCSGLIIRAVCDVQGRNSADWPLEQRHVRDMWAMAQAQREGFELTELAVGALRVTARKYLISEQRTVIAGHIGIVTAINEATFGYAHASSSSGRVEEIQLPYSAACLGLFAAPVL